MNEVHWIFIVDLPYSAHLLQTFLTISQHCWDARNNS